MNAQTEKIRRKLDDFIHGHVSAHPNPECRVLKEAWWAECGRGRAPDATQTEPCLEMFAKYLTCASRAPTAPKTIV